MSTVATPAEQPDIVTWRDAVTPLSRASRQRWTIAYAILLALLAASVVGDTFAIERTGIQAIPLLLLVALAVVFGMLRRGTRRIAALDHPDLDERDLAARNGAYRIAFPLLVLVVLVALVLLAVSAPDEARRIGLGSDGFREAGGVFVEWPALTGLGLWIVLWAVFLPTGVLAWLEPDPLEPETSAGGLPDALRDGLLGLALAGGLAASLVADSDIGLVAFVAALALLGGLGRRASGQPVISRQRMWRVAIGVVMILVVMAIGVASNASAAAPWTAPAAIPDASGFPTRSVVTRAGNAVVLSGQVRGPGHGPTLLARVGQDGSVTSTRSLSFVATALETYGRDRIVVAGRTLATTGPYTGTIGEISEIVTRSGTPDDLGPARTIAGTKGRQLNALATNSAGLTALVIGTLRTRTVLVRRPSSTTFRVKLRIRVGPRARGATVAVGDGGDVLLVYEDEHEVRARHIGPRGSAGAVHRLGAGVQSDLQAIVGADGRMSVAWKSQRVNEGESSAPAIVSFATAAPGHGFAKARTIASVGAAGGGRYVAPPGVRLVADGDVVLLAYTGFDGSRYTVEARQVTGGRPGPAQRLSPAGLDAVLGDAAVSANGAQVVAWRAGVAGAEPVQLPGGMPAPTPVLASVRAAGGAAFGGAEAISPNEGFLPYPPSAAIDPVSGRSFVAYATFSPAVAVYVAARPAP